MFHLFLLILLSLGTCSIIPTHEVPRETTQPTTASPSPRRTPSFVSPLTAFLSNKVVPPIKFGGDFLEALDGIFFSGYMTNIFALHTDLIFGQGRDLSTIRLVPYIDYTALQMSLDDTFRAKGANITGLASFEGKLSDPETLAGLFSNGLVKALQWRTNPPLMVREKEESVGSIGISKEEMKSQLHVNDMVLMRSIRLLGASFDSNSEMEYIILRLLLKDSEENQERLTECFKLIEESPAYEMSAKILPPLYKELELAVPRITLQIALMRTFKLFRLTSFDPAYKGIKQMKTHFSPAITHMMYNVSIDGLFPLLLGNFHANKAQPVRDLSDRSLVFRATLIERVSVGKGIKPEILDQLKEALGYSAFAGRFEKIGYVDDEVLANSIAEILRGVPDRTRIIGVLFGWIRESAKFIIQDNLYEAFA